MRPHADGTISFVPGMGEDEDGILVAIGGGNDDGLLPMDEVGIYHADVSTWSTRKTSGDAPEGRVNHCAVRGTAFVDGLWKVCYAHLLSMSCRTNLTLQIRAKSSCQFVVVNLLASRG